MPDPPPFLLDGAFIARAAHHAPRTVRTTRTLTALPNASALAAAIVHRLSRLGPHGCLPAIIPVGRCRVTA